MENIISPVLIGWRTENYLWETKDVTQARNWEPNIGVIPIFAGDPNTSLDQTPVLTPNAKVRGCANTKGVTE